jgi:Methyltransferase domain
MAYSKQWDTVYAQGSNLSIWPWSDLVSYVYRYAPINSSDTKVLEIGFGAGANIPFFRTLGVCYFGIEGSDAIASKVRERYPDWSSNLITGDFIEHRYEDTYDLIVDRSSMTHNDTSAILRGLRNISDVMADDARYIGIDWFSTVHSGFSRGEVVDEHTKCNIADGQFQGVGKVHFSDERHLIELFLASGMRITRLEHKEFRSMVPVTGQVFASWNLVAEKMI